MDWTGGLKIGVEAFHDWNGTGRKEGPDLKKG